jgi:hypothetical protein
MQLCSPYERLALSISISGTVAFQPSYVDQRQRFHFARSSWTKSSVGGVFIEIAVASDGFNGSFLASLFFYEHALSVLHSFVFDRG